MSLELTLILNIYKTIDHFMRTVFHLNSGEASKQSELLGNIQNFLDDKSVEVHEIAVVVNADGVKMVGKDSGASDFIKDYPEKVKFYACSNSIENREMEGQIIDRVKKVPSGVGKLNQLQEENYNYIKI